MGGDFSNVKNFSRGKRKNGWGMCYSHFRLWLLCSKLIFFKEGLLIIYSAAKTFFLCNMLVFQLECICI